MTSPSETVTTTATTLDPSIQISIDKSTNESETNVTPLNTITSSSKSTTKTIDQELADTAKAHSKRRAEMSSNTPRITTIIGKVVHAVKTDHNTARLSLICLSLVFSFFGSLLLVIAGADPPYHNGALYQYNDLMRLVTSIHEKTIEITPGLSRKSLEDEVRNSTSPTESTESSASRLTRLLQEWWPIKKIDFESNDAILNDYNFYTRNYRTFQIPFTVLMCFGDIILLLSWIYFLAAKELQIYRHRKDNRNGHNTNGIKSPKPFSERASALYEKLKRFFAGKQLKKLKRSWCDDAPMRPWKRPSVVIIFSIVLANILLFILLMIRPSMFTLVMHQVLFVCLAVVCLASTEVHAPKIATSNTIIKDMPRSLRNINGSQNGSNNRIHFQSPSLVGVANAPTPTVPIKAPIFVTEESKASTSGIVYNQSPRGSNPFDEDDDEENDDDDDEDDPFVEPKKSKTEKKKEPIDEESEKEVESV